MVDALIRRSEASCSLYRYEGRHDSNENETRNLGYLPWSTTVFANAVLIALLGRTGSNRRTAGGASNIY